MDTSTLQANLSVRTPLNAPQPHGSYTHPLGFATPVGRTRGTMSGNGSDTGERSRHLPTDSQHDISVGVTPEASNAYRLFTVPGSGGSVAGVTPATSAASCWDHRGTFTDSGRGRHGRHCLSAANWNASSVSVSRGAGA